MDEQIVEQGERILYKSEVSTKTCIASKLKSNSMLILMWILMDAFFVYLIFLQEIASKYWFVSIPIIGFNILGVVALYIGCARELSGLADKTYILTDKAIYFINHSSYKQTKRIAISDVARFEKDKSNSHIFYVCTQNDFIKVEYIENEMNFYSQLAKLINSR